MRTQILSGLALVAVAVIAVLVVQRVQAYPEPAIAPRAWEFEFTIEKPQPIPYKTTDGRVVPEGARLIWPFMCKPR